MELILLTSKTTTKTPISRDFHWYDYESKQMQTFTGGRLDFKYDFEKKKSMPHIVNEFELNASTNLNEIKKWIKSNQSKFGFSIIEEDNYHITIDVEDDEMDMIEIELRKNKIQYDY